MHLYRLCRYAVLAVVSHILCDTYDIPAVLAAVRRLLDNLGGMEAFVKPGQTVFIKPNMLGGAAPEVAKTTHPAVVYAVAKLAVDAGAQVFVGDSPGGEVTDASIGRALALCGFEEAAKTAGAKTLICNMHQTMQLNRSGNRIEVCADMLNADVVINIAKAKTHTFAGYTGAVKNLYGVIPGYYKAAYHAAHPVARDFMNFIVDIAQTFPVALHIIDGIVGMEGPGPSAGWPKPIGSLVASANPHDADWVMLQRMGWNPQEVGSVQCAVERGLRMPENPLVLGDAVTAIKLPVKRPVKKSSVLSMMRIGLPHGLQRRFRLLPIIQKGCVGCGVCAKSCPVKAIDMCAGRAHVDKATCISCFCCQELCPLKAIKSGVRFV